MLFQVAKSFLEITQIAVLQLRCPSFAFQWAQRCNFVLKTVLHRCQMKDLLEKSKVPIDDCKARVMIGVADDTKTLQYGEVGRVGLIGGVGRLILRALSAALCTAIISSRCQLRNHCNAANAALR